MTPAELEEQVADAIEAAYRNDDDSRAAMKRMALAAITAVREAMREPTKEMVLSGDIAKEDCIDSDWDSDADGNRHYSTTINSDLPAIVWRAMLAASPIGEGK